MQKRENNPFMTRNGHDNHHECNVTFLFDRPPFTLAWSLFLKAWKQRDEKRRNGFRMFCHRPCFALITLIWNAKDGTHGIWFVLLSYVVQPSLHLSQCIIFSSSLLQRREPRENGETIFLPFWDSYFQGNGCFILSFLWRGVKWKRTKKARPE